MSRLGSVACVLFSIVFVGAAGCGGGSAPSSDLGGASSGSDAGSLAADAGAPADAGPADGGATASDCDGLVPQPPAAPLQFTLEKQDRTDGDCIEGETDGTGHVVATWVQTQNTEGHSRHTFVDPGTATVVGSYGAANMRPIGQASGFEGTDCVDGRCYTGYQVLSPTGQELYKSPSEGPSLGITVNDPSGGFVHVLYDSSADPSYRVEAVSASGAVRWSVTLPRPVPPASSSHLSLTLGVDRQGNVLALKAYTNQDTWDAQWISRDGVAGAVFHPLAQGQQPALLWTRVENGFFLYGFEKTGGRWLGTFEPRATSLTPVPRWLAVRSPTNMHMVHGGKGYAFIPMYGVASASCEQTIEVVSRSGQSCGSATFAVGGGSCSTSSIVVGYDGTVVQQLPREREEATCRFNDHECNCTYRYWPRFFR
jgi:hypothetical protein